MGENEGGNGNKFDSSLKFCFVSRKKNKNRKFSKKENKPKKFWSNYIFKVLVEEEEKKKINLVAVNN